MSNITNHNTKVCSKCKIEKLKSDFYPSRTKSGNPSVYSACKECCSKYCQTRNREIRESRPKRVIEDLVGEAWVPVVGYESKYMVSNLGRVKSIDRWIYRELIGKEVFVEGTLLAQTKPDKAYPMVTIYGKTQKDKYPIAVYLIVFWSFNRHIQKKEGYEVDHIDNDKTNSKLSNLQYIKTRHNSAKRSMNLRKTSRFTGVYWDKSRNKWCAQIRINGRSTSLGRFADELDAAMAYQKALKQIENK